MDSRRRSPLLVTLVVLMSFCHGAAGAGRQIHVSHGGNDTDHCGTSVKKACKTIGRALALSGADDVVVLDDAGDTYTVNTTASGHLNVTHSLTIHPLGRTATISCADGRAALFHVFDPDHEPTLPAADSPAVTLTLADLKIRDCAGTWRRPDTIRITNAAVRMRQCQLLNGGTIVDWPDRAGRPCDVAKLVVSDTQLNHCGLSKPYVPCVSLTDCDRVHVAVHGSSFVSSALQLRADRNLDVQLQQVTFHGQTLRGPSVDVTLASNLSSVVLTNVVVDGHQGKSSALVVAVEQPVRLPTVHFNNVTFANNSFVKSLGGAVGLVSRSSSQPLDVRVQFNGCTFSGNSAGEVGGAVYAVRIADVTFTDCVFTENVGVQGGAVMLAGVRGASFVNSTFVGNRAVGVNNTKTNGLGGAIRALESDLILNSCRFVNNAAGLQGQSVHINQNGTVQIVDCSFVTGMPADGTAIGVQLYLQQVDASDEPIVLVNNSYEVNRQNSSRLYYIEAAATLKVKANKVCCPPGQHVSLILDEPYVLTGFDRSTELQYARCRACPPGTYNLLQQCLQTDRLHRFRNDNEIICAPCPENARCPGEGMIVAQRNYWGWRADNVTNEVVFVLCPVGYCSQAECQGIECCSGGREGVLCGKCRAGYSYDLAAKSCVDGEENPSMLVKIIVLAVAFGLLYLMLIASMVAISHFCLATAGLVSFTNVNVTLSDGDGSTGRRSAADGSDDPLLRIDSDENSDSFEPTLLPSFPFISLSDSSSQQVDEQTQTSVSGRHGGAADFRPLRELEFTACVMWMLLQLFDDVYKVWYSSRLQSTLIISILDLINLRPVFVVLKRPYISGTMASIAEVWLALVSLGTMFTMLMLVFIIYCVVQKAISRVRCMDTSKCRSHFAAVLTKVVVVCIVLTYVPLVRCCLRLVHCVHIGAASGEKVAFYNGTIPCNQWWQWLAAILMITHVAPVGFLVYLVLPLIRIKRVTQWQFMVCLMFPLLAILYLMCKQSKYICRCLFPSWQRYVSMEYAFYVTDDCSLTPSDIIHSFFTCPFRLQSKQGPSGSDPDAGKRWVMLAFIRAAILVALSTMLKDQMHLSSVAVVILLFVLTMAHVMVQPYRCWHFNCAEAVMLFSLTTVSFLNLTNTLIYTLGTPFSSYLSTFISASDWIYVMMMLSAMIGNLAFVGYQTIMFSRSKKSRCVVAEMQRFQIKPQ